MTCWHGHMPHMNDDQMRQAIDAYMGKYQAEWERQWARSPFTQDIPLPHEVPPPPTGRRTSLETAREVDKAGAIEVEYVRVR